jgi:aerobic carbon-monoxide dehydrogenase small subunit
MSEHDITLTVNGITLARRVPARLTLLDFLRQDLGLTGTHVGCEHGVCGACTVLVGGLAVRACLMFAVQSDGAEIGTIEGVAGSDGTLHPVQQALHESHGLQCGFCTPGIVMTLKSLTEANGTASREQMVEALSGHICRCTGYQGILRAIDRLTAEAKEQADG